MLLKIDSTVYFRDKNCDRYTVYEGNTNRGQFVVPHDFNDNITFYTDDLHKQHVDISEAICAIFNKPVHIKSNSGKTQVIDTIDIYKPRNTYVLLHTKRNKYNEHTFYRFDEYIGHVYQDKKNITFNAKFLLGDRDTYEIVCGITKLMDLYKNNITLNVDGRSYVIPQKTPRVTISAMYQNSLVPLHYDGKVVGTYRYTTDGVEFTPGMNIPLSHAINGALFLKQTCGRPLTFICPNDKCEMLVKLYAREQRKRAR